MIETARVLRCPRCGARDVAVSATPIAELDELFCAACGLLRTCDEHQLRAEWNEDVSVHEAAPDSVLPRPRFVAMWRALGASSLADETLRRLRAAYAEPARAYHTARHVGACLALLDELATALSLDDAVRAEIEAALWFHDAVYDPRARDNEERSAAWADQALREGGADVGVAERVASHVRATRDHSATSEAAALVVDIDLSILGSPWPKLVRFEEEIRREYAWVSRQEFIIGRAAVLRRLLARPHVYRTPVARERFEARARVNLRATLASLFERARSDLLARAAEWCAIPRLVETWEYGDGRGFLDDDARARASTERDAREAAARAFTSTRDALARDFPSEWNAWLAALSSRVSALSVRSAETAEWSLALDAERTDSPRDAWAFATALDAAVRAAPPPPRHRLVVRVDDDGAFHRSTTYDVVDDATGDTILSYFSDFTDSMFADQKVYAGVRDVTLASDGTHVLVHQYEGPSERVALWPNL